MTQRNSETQALRAYIEAKKRDVRAAEQRYDIPAAAAALEALALPLTSSDTSAVIGSEAFPASWKALYIDVFYRDVVDFLVGFVTIHIASGFSAQQRAVAIDAFFDVDRIAATAVVSALASALTRTKLPSDTDTDDNAAGADARATIAQCVAQLERALDANALDTIVTALLELQDASPDGRSLATAQPLVATLCALPDVVANRCGRATPSNCTSRRFIRRLSTSLFAALRRHFDAVRNPNTRNDRVTVFRLVIDKLIRIGHVALVVDRWLFSRAAALDVATYASFHAQLLAQLPESTYEPLLLALLALAPPPVAASTPVAPQYRLVSLLPDCVITSTHFQFVVAQKVVLRKPIVDLFLLRVLIDAFAAASPACLAAVFDRIARRWSQPTFVEAADYALDASVSFFLRYALQQLRNQIPSDCVLLLCQGVQHHMQHSVAQTRALGMRVGESLSLILSPEKPLVFGLQDADPLVVFGNDDFDGAAAIASDNDRIEPTSDNRDVLHSNPTTSKRVKNATRKSIATPFALDADELVAGDDDSDSDVSDSDPNSDSDSDSDSDASLDAFDVADDEQDLQTKRPMYLRDLVASLYADDDRARTETALGAAASLLRQAPRDVDDTIVDVVTALLRLEDKYNTPQFDTQRSLALAAACVVSPVRAASYLQRQALEREQLLQSRLDALHAIATAAQELALVGAFRNRQPAAAENAPDDDMETRTLHALLQSSKTRRFGARRHAVTPTKNAFAEHALAFFSPLLVGYVAYKRALLVADADALTATPTARDEVESLFLAHLLHTLALLVECAGHAPVALPLAKSLLAFAYAERLNRHAAVRRQVVFSLSRVLLVASPSVVFQEIGYDAIAQLAAWLEMVRKTDADAGCRDGAQLLLASGIVPSMRSIM